MPASPTKSESTAVVDGRRLAFMATEGEGATVLLLHGFGADRLTWLITQREVSDYAATIAVDLPGHGRSDRDVGPGDVSFLADLIAGFLSERGSGPVHIVGHSLGGGIAIDLAFRRPECVASLFLIAPAGLGEGIDPAFLAAVTEMESLDQASAVLARLVTRRRLISPQMTARVLEQISEPGTREGLRRIAGRMATIKTDLGDALRAVGDSDLRVHVLWGDHDGVNPPEYDRDGLIFGPVERIADSGHLPHIENPGAVNRSIRTFLDEAMERRG